VKRNHQKHEILALIKMFTLYFGPRDHVISSMVTNVADESAAFIFRVCDDGSSRFL
jgi:hypothetical protein